MTAPVRWTTARKEAVVIALHTGKIDVELACRAHSLTPEELASWQRRFACLGRPGLAVTKLQTLNLNDEQRA